MLWPYSIVQSIYKGGSLPHTADAEMLLACNAKKAGTKRKRNKNEKIKTNEIVPPPLPTLSSPLPLLVYALRLVLVEELYQGRNTASSMTPGHLQLFSRFFPTTYYKQIAAFRGRYMSTVEWESDMAHCALSTLIVQSCLSHIIPIRSFRVEVHFGSSW